MHFVLVIPAEMQIPPCCRRWFFFSHAQQKHAPNQNKHHLPKTARQLLSKEDGDSEAEIFTSLKWLGLLP